jgi:CheY-like chemotaxis protein
VLVRTSIPKTVDLVLNTAPDLPPIEADPAQIQQVIMNLLINAGEAIGENKQGRLEVRTSSREFDAREAAELFRPEHSKPGIYIQVEVKDNGPGMDEATKARIFEPFFTTKFTGRGLGLAAVQGIVKAHGGAIRVYSTPGHGTTFVVFLPAKSAGAVEVRAAKMGQSAIPPHSVVLVIEDEPVIRSVVTRVLSKAGVKVLTAENGKQGVELFREHQPIISLVLLDLQMPVMGGEEALAHLKEIDPDVTIILSSGFDESEAHRRFSNLDLAAFLQKPYTNDRLIEAVAAALQRKRSSQAET